MSFSNAAYSNMAIFASEAIAMCFTIFLGEAVIANEVLSQTKGRAMGWGFVAFGFGLAFGVCIAMFSYISAHLNPATCIALLILGKIDGIGFVAAVSGEFLGGFVGALLVWLHFLPHFKTVPEPPAADVDDMLLRSRDALTPTALGIASYNTREDDVAARRRGIGDVTHGLQDIAYYLRDGHRELSAHAALVEVALGPTELKSSPGLSTHSRRLLRRRSVQVCDVHRRLKDMDIEEFKAMLLSPELHHRTEFKKGTSSPAGTAHGSTDDLRRAKSSNSVPPPLSLLPPSGGTPLEAAAEARGEEQQPGVPASAFAPAAAQAEPEAAAEKTVHPAVDNRQKRLDRLYDAALVADQNAKLSIFCTRPAIYSPLLNFVCEAMCTIALVYGALMIYARRDQLYGPEKALYRSFEGFLIGFFIFLCVLGLGGPTGIAANPARDLSPRLAHWILPIPGKGPSEWYYSWIPVLAPFAGGCASAGLYAATELLNHSNVPANQTFPSARG